jgi:hypothetical protein
MEYRTQKLKRKEYFGLCYQLFKQKDEAGNKIEKGRLKQISDRLIMIHMNVALFQSHKLLEKYRKQVIQKKLSPVALQEYMENRIIGFLEDSDFKKDTNYLRRLNIFSYQVLCLFKYILYKLNIFEEHGLRNKSFLINFDFTSYRETINSQTMFVLKKRRVKFITVCQTFLSYEETVELFLNKVFIAAMAFDMTMVDEVVGSPECHWFHDIDHSLDFYKIFAERNKENYSAKFFKKLSDEETEINVVKLVFLRKFYHYFKEKRDRGEITEIKMDAIIMFIFLYIHEGADPNRFIHYDSVKKRYFFDEFDTDEISYLIPEKYSTKQEELFEHITDAIKEYEQVVNQENIIFSLNDLSKSPEEYTHNSIDRLPPPSLPFPADDDKIEFIDPEFPSKSKEPKSTTRKSRSPSHSKTSKNHLSSHSDS